MLCGREKWTAFLRKIKVVYVIRLLTKAIKGNELLAPSDNVQEKYFMEF